MSAPWEDDELEMDLEREREWVRKFEARIVETIGLGAGNRETALRWIVEGLELTDVDLMYGGDLICFELDLPYSYKAEFDPITAQLLQKVAA